MRVKRWIFLALAGTGLINLAVAMVMYEFFRPKTDLTPLALLALGIGLGAMAVGASRVVAVVVDVLQPEADLVDAMYQSRTRRRGPKLVAIGGGTGLSTLLRGLKEYTDNITAIVTVADDGGSSGRLREELGVQPPGDIRSCLIALAREERLLTDLFRFRFPGDTGLGGHSFGNLFLAAMIGVTGDLMKAIQHSSRVLAVRGQVLPATMGQMTLLARLADDSVVVGESSITARKEAIADMWCEPSLPIALPEAVRAIEEADAIILGPGSLFTSLVPHLLIPGLREALQASHAPRIYVCNVMTQPGETDGFKASDHLRVLARFGGAGICSSILVNEALPWLLRDRYSARSQFAVELDWDALVAMGVTPVRGAFIDEADGVRHNSNLLAAAIMTWIEGMPPRGRSTTGERARPLVGDAAP